MDVRADRFHTLGFDLRDVDSVAARVGYNLATGLDDRGLMYLRFGPPDGATLGGDNKLDPQCNTDELERWRYAEWGEVRFVKPSALFSKGLRTTPEMVFRPMNEHQFETMTLGLTRDASSEPAPLAFGVWTAQFQNRLDAGRTDLVVVSTEGELAAALTGILGGERHVRQSRAGRVTLTDAPGRYVLLAHARQEDTLGRQALALTLRSFAAPAAMSDLLLAKAWPADTTDRESVVARVQRDLTFAGGETVRVYAEVYGLAQQGGTVTYHAAYRLLRSGDLARDLGRDEWQGATSLEFTRVRPVSGSGAVAEVLDISPDYIPPGRYLLRLEVRDNLAAVRVGRATIAFEIR